MWKMLQNSINFPDFHADFQYSSFTYVPIGHLAGKI